MNYLPRSLISRNAITAAAALSAIVMSGTGFPFSSCDGVSQRKVAKDPRECANPVCSDSLRAFQLASDSLASKPAKSPQKDSSLVVPTPVPCPLTKGELGEKTWSLLHTMAAYYPESPSKEQQEAMDSFLRALSLLYPCPYCAEDFAESIKASPPRVESQEALTLWLCEQHNEINRKLDKPTFPCSLPDLRRRWREGDGQCKIIKRDDIDELDGFDDPDKQIQRES